MAQAKRNNPGTRKAKKPIIIAGGGIGGLATALALSQQGFASRVLEQASKFGEIGAGIQLGPNANRAIERLGLTKPLARDIVDIDALIMMDSLADKPISNMPVAENVLQRFGHPYYVVHRADLHGRLLAACKKRRDITLETSRAVTGFEQDEDGVTVHLKDHKPVEGTAIIGADGLWSKIRAQLLKDGPPRFANHTCYRTLLEPDEMPEDLRWNAATLWAGPDTHLVHYPIKAHNKFNIVATFGAGSYEEGWNIEGDRDELMHHFRHLKSRPMQILNVAKSWRKWSLCDRDPVKTWSKGRATLLGDAAHPMLQYFAQGAAMAIEDGLCLAETLKAHDGTAAPAFAAYQDARTERTARVQLRARELGRVYHARGAKRWLRNWYLRRTPPDKLLDGLEWLYTGT